jgi:predicted acyl esterase
VGPVQAVTTVTACRKGGAKSDRHNDTPPPQQVEPLQAALLGPTQAVTATTVPAPQNQAAFDFIAQVLRHPSYDEFWRERTPVDRLADIDIPVYSIANWNQAGLHLRGNLYGYEPVRGPKKLLVNGGPIGDAHSSINIFNDQGFHEHLLGWFDQWLKGVNTGILDEPGSV